MFANGYNVIGFCDNFFLLLNNGYGVLKQVWIFFIGHVVYGYHKGLLPICLRKGDCNMSDDRQMERVSASALRLVWRCFDTVSVDDT